MYLRSIGVLATAAPRFIRPNPTLLVRFSSTVSTFNSSLSEEEKKAKRWAIHEQYAIPESVLEKPVRIVKTTRHAMQSIASDNSWRLEFAKVGTQWEERLMGWTSTSDPMFCVKLKFSSIQDAEQFCQDYGIFPPSFLHILIILQLLIIK